MPLSFDCTIEQMVQGITVNPKTAAGNPSSIEGLPTCSIIDGNPNNGCTVAPDGSINLIPGGDNSAIGTTIYKIAGDADLGEGVIEIADTVTLNVAGAQAANLGLSGGTVVTKPLEG